MKDNTKKCSVIIIDDEKLERVLIINAFNWEENGFSIVGDFSSGADALKFLEENEVDIVLTDINMPKMDGLAFVENAQKTFPDYETRYIIVTGFRDFEYARKAVKLGVKDFLLKPVDFSELGETVNKIREEIIGASDEKNQELLILNQTVKKAVKIIEENLSDSSLSLGFVADKVYTNPSYLSRIFKKEMDQSFNGFILKKRIEEAQYLFDTTDMKLYEVAEKVGFEDSSYFSVCFKKITGLNVTEYKKNL